MGIRMVGLVSVSHGDIHKEVGGGKASELWKEFRSLARMIAQI
jgi:hypothetical protein